MLIVAVTLYAAQLAPFVAGPLTECRHCVAQYARLYAVLPGTMPAMLLRLEDGAFLAVAALGTAAVIASLASLARILSPKDRAAALALAACVLGWWSVAFSHVLRM